MYKCKICGKGFDKRISLERHVTVSYGKEKEKVHCPILAYRYQYEGEEQFSESNLRSMYNDEMKSTPMISEELRVNKKTLIDLMHYYGIELRDASSATINQIERDGLWNKGKTKYNHPSVMKYAKSRRGKNNPYYTAPGYEKRHKQNLERWKTIQRGLNGNRNPKTTEARLAKLLDKCGMQYIRNLCIKYGTTWRLYDFLIEGNLIVEMQGNYYHANPKTYGPDDVIVISRSRRIAKHIWEYDKEKEILAKNCGYDYMVIWEDDFCSMDDNDVMQMIGGVA